MSDITVGLNHFDAVVVRGSKFNDTPYSNMWRCANYSHYVESEVGLLYVADGQFWKECLPYNDDTSKLVGTFDDYVQEHNQGETSDISDKDEKGKTATNLAFPDKDEVLTGVLLTDTDYFYIIESNRLGYYKSFSEGLIFE